MRTAGNAFGNKFAGLSGASDRDVAGRTVM
jgi:hypothetical protein